MTIMSWWMYAVWFCEGAAIAWACVSLRGWLERRRRNREVEARLRELLTNTAAFGTQLGDSGHEPVVSFIGGPRAGSRCPAGELDGLLEPHDGGPIDGGFVLSSGVRPANRWGDYLLVGMSTHRDDNSLCKALYAFRPEGAQ